MSRYFSSAMQRMIEQYVGMSLDDIRSSGIEDIHASIERRIGKKLEIGKEPGILGRGSMYIQLDRTISRKQIDSDMEKYFKDTHR